MSHYVIEENLSTTREQKFASVGLSIIVSAVIIAFLYFMHIVVPNPPFEVKSGEVELDFGLQEVSYGKPDEGGPSETPPAQGGSTDVSPQSSSPTPNVSQGGHGNIVNTNDETAEMGLPPIDPPASKTPAVNSRLKSLTTTIGKRTKSTTEGIEGGIKGGIGTIGSGPGGPNVGITGNGGTRVTNNRGNGFFTAAGFSSHQINSTVKNVSADGVGEIVARVIVTCQGTAQIKSMLASGNYTGTAANAKKVMEYFINQSKFARIGDKCPETGTITLNVKKGLN